MEEDTPEKKLTLFDYLNTISYTKDDLFVVDGGDKPYNSYMVNRFLSAELDTLLYANELNTIPQIDKKMHYDFLRIAIPKRKRYFKYIKTEKLEQEELVKKFFGYNSAKAKEVMSILSEEDYEIIRQTFEVGGVKETAKGGRTRAKD